MDNGFEIRTFASPDEIRALPGYKADNPINNNNYEKIIGDYWFPDKERCCFLKENGNLCGTEHNWGFVARLSDKTVTVIGNCCAVNKFDADSKMKADRSRYLNEKRRRDAFAELQELLASKEEIASKLKEAISEVKNLKKEAEEFSSQLGGAALKRLEDMYRTGASAVVVQGVSYREYNNEDGDKAKERTITTHTVGRLAGLSCLISSTFSGVARDARQALAALDRAEALQDSASISEIKSVSADIGGPDRVERLVSKLRSEVSAFIQNDFLLFCFLTTDKSERYKYAQLALQQRGDDAGKGKAKAWLAEREQDLARAFSVDKVATQ
jgi:hypothetical protein